MERPAESKRPEAPQGKPTDLFAQVADTASIVEVSPRDGLQNENAVLPVSAKLRLIEALADAGLPRLEITSFVSPRWVPQLADAADVCRAVPARAGVVYSALVPNARGLEQALAVGIRDVAVFLSASETHNRVNVNKTIDDTLAVFAEIVPMAREAGARVRAYLSTVWGCPYEGAVDLARAVQIGRRLIDLGCFELSLGDTIGVGTPRQTQDIVGAFLGEIPCDALALHLHDTRGTALANVLVGLELGLRNFDASVGGIGGCPYAPGASGNLATEDLVYMLNGLGVTTGVDLEKLIAAGNVAEQLLGRPLVGKVHRAGVFRTRPRSHQRTESG